MFIDPMAAFILFMVAVYIVTLLITIFTSINKRMKEKN